MHIQRRPEVPCVRFCWATLAAQVTLACASAQGVVPAARSPYANWSDADYQQHANAESPGGSPPEWVADQLGFLEKLRSAGEFGNDGVPFTAEDVRTWVSLLYRDWGDAERNFNWQCIVLTTLRGIRSESKEVRGAVREGLTDFYAAGGGIASAQQVVLLAESLGSHSSLFDSDAIELSRSLLDDADAWADSIGRQSLSRQIAAARERLDRDWHAGSMSGHGAATVQGEPRGTDSSDHALEKRTHTVNEILAELRAVGRARPPDAAAMEIARNHVLELVDDHATLARDARMAVLEWLRVCNLILAREGDQIAAPVRGELRAGLLWLVRDKRLADDRNAWRTLARCINLLGVAGDVELAAVLDDPALVPALARKALHSSRSPSSAPTGR